MKNHLEEQIISEFGSEITQKIYCKNAHAGLWESEEILIEKYFKQNSTVLDVGCGTGRTTIPMHKMGYKITGMDIVPAMIENARKIAETNKLKIKYEIGDATALTYESNSFDNVLFSFNGWAQIPGQNNRLQALKEIYRVLTPDGYFIFTSLIRSTVGFKFFWIRKWIRINILKPLGLKIVEVDFGDLFFYRKDGEKQYSQKQFMHFHSTTEVKRQLVKAGFKLIFFERGNIISDKDTGEAPPMFFVCKK